MQTKVHVPTLHMAICMHSVASHTCMCIFMHKCIGLTYGTLVNTPIHIQSIQLMCWGTPPLYCSQLFATSYCVMSLHFSWAPNKASHYQLKRPVGNLPPPKKAQKHTYIHTPLMTYFLRHISYCAVINGKVMAFKKPVFSLQTKSCTPQQWLNE